MTYRYVVRGMCAKGVNMTPGSFDPSEFMHTFWVNGKAKVPGFINALVRAGYSIREITKVN